MIESLVMAGGSILGAGISVLGAQGAADDAADAQEMALAWEMKKYQDWKNLYGDIEKNLSDYYENLSPEVYAARGIEAIETEFNQVQANMNEFMVSRGIREDSGLGASLKQEQNMGRAIARARVRAEAPQAVADAKQNFLGLGFQKSQGDPGAILRQDMQNKSTLAMNAAGYAGEAVGTAIYDSATALGDYLNRPKKVTVPVTQPTVTYSSGGR